MEKQKGFVPLFLFILIADFLTALGMASQDEILVHICFVWLGPLDDIFYLIVGLQAAVFLLDPIGRFSQTEKGGFSPKSTWQHLSGGTDAQGVFARGFTEGCGRTLTALPALLIACLALNFALLSLPGVAAQNLLYRYISYVLPISFVVVGGFRLIGLGVNSDNYWKASVLGMAAVVGVATMDGRWYNHIYHLFSNLENVQAWCATLAWAAFFAARSETFVGLVLLNDEMTESEALPLRSSPA